MVLIYAFDIRRLPDPQGRPEIMRGLPVDRTEKIMKYRQPADRRRSLGAGLLLREVLSRHGAAEDILHTGGNGKPEAERVCFNLSHGGDMVVCAVGRKAIGCDVEMVRKAPERVASRFFREGEQRYLNSFPETGKDEAFFRIWTMKESYMKMTGEGLGLDPGRFEILPGDRLSRVRRDGAEQPCGIREYEIPGYRAAVCSLEDEFADKVEFPDNLISKTSAAASREIFHTGDNA